MRRALFVQTEIVGGGGGERHRKLLLQLIADFFCVPPEICPRKTKSTSESALQCHVTLVLSPPSFSEAKLHDAGPPPPSREINNAQ